MFPGLDLMTSYASFRTVTLVATSKTLVYRPSGPLWRRESMMSAGEGGDVISVGGDVISVGVEIGSLFTETRASSCFRSVNFRILFIGPLVGAFACPAPWSSCIGGSSRGVTPGPPVFGAWAHPFPPRFNPVAVWWSSINTHLRMTSHP